MALIAAHLNAGRSGGDSVAIGIYSPSSPTSIPPFPPFFPSLISRMVSVDVKHHVYLQTAIESFVLDLTHTVTLALTSLYAVSLGTPENSAIQKLTIITTIYTHVLREKGAVRNALFWKLEQPLPTRTSASNGDKDDYSTHKAYYHTTHENFSPSIKYFLIITKKEERS